MYIIITSIKSYFTWLESYFNTLKIHKYLPELTLAAIEQQKLTNEGWNVKITCTVLGSPHALHVTYGMPQFMLSFN